MTFTGIDDSFTNNQSLRFSTNKEAGIQLRNENDATTGSGRITYNDRRPFKFGAGTAKKQIKPGDWYTFLASNTAVKSVPAIATVFETLKNIRTDLKDTANTQTLKALDSATKVLHAVVVRHETAGEFEKENAVVLLFMHTEGVMVALATHDLSLFADDKNKYDMPDQSTDQIDEDDLIGAPYDRIYPPWVVKVYSHILPNGVIEAKSQTKKE